MPQWLCCPEGNSGLSQPRRPPDKPPSDCCNPCPWLWWVCVGTGTAARSSPGSLTSSTSLFAKEKFQWVHPTHGTQVQKLYLSAPLPRRSHAPWVTPDVLKNRVSLWKASLPIPERVRLTGVPIPVPRSRQPLPPPELGEGISAFIKGRGGKNSTSARGGPVWAYL